MEFWLPIGYLGVLAHWRYHYSAVKVGLAAATEKPILMAREQTDIDGHSGLVLASSQQG
jgi:hypothetical protein